MAKSKAELDFVRLGDWCAYCDGSREFDDYHFSTILMGVFLEGLTPEVDAFLREFSKPFPRPLYDRLVRICGPAEPDCDILPWVKRDLDEMRKLLALQYTPWGNLTGVLDQGRTDVTHDRRLLHDIKMTSDNHSGLYEEVCDFVIEVIHGRNRDDRLFALREALYHIATDYFVAHSIMAPLLDTDIDLSHFFEIYLRGGDYAIDTDRIVVYQYQPAENVSN